MEKERLHVTLRPGLKRAAKRKAFEERTSVSAVVEEALERWVCGGEYDAMGCGDDRDA